MDLDEARLLANVNARANRLYEDGYRIRSLDGNLHQIHQADGPTYTLDRAAQSCTCPFFTQHGGRYRCKHLLGWRKLLLAQRMHLSRLSARWEAVEQAARTESVLRRTARALRPRLEAPLCQ